MHYAILNSSGNALGWFTDEAEARNALAEMLADSSDVDLDLVAFEGPGRPVEPVTPSARSAWPVARLVWSRGSVVRTGDMVLIVDRPESGGNIDRAMVTSEDIAEPVENATDDVVVRNA